MAGGRSCASQKPNEFLERRMIIMKAKTLVTGLLVSIFLVGCCWRGETKHSAKAQTIPLEAATPELPNESLVYENDFSGYALGEEPEDLFILDGEFSVKEEQKNKVLALPGVPIGDFGILFGPRIKGKPIELRCRMFSTRKGRRLPAFAAGLGGLNGFRLRIDCPAGKLRLLRGEDVLAEEPFAWKSGSWMHLRFRVEPAGEEGAKVLCKVWDAIDKEPPEWSLVHRDKAPFAGGKCVLWGIPYAGTEIYFDDLRVFSLAD